MPSASMKCFEVAGLSSGFDQFRERGMLFGRGQKPRWLGYGLDEALLWQGRSQVGEKERPSSRLCQSAVFPVWTSSTKLLCRLLSAQAVMSSHSPTRANDAAFVPTEDTSTELQNIARGAATSMREFCVPSTVPRFSSGTRSMTRKPRRAEIGPENAPSTIAPRSRKT